MTKRLVLVLVAILAVTASLAAYYRTSSGNDAPQYVTAAASRGDVVDAVEATGTLEAVTTVQVGSQVSGTIASLHADFNSRVSKGQVVARLDPSLLQAQVDQAQATVTRLEAEVDRSRIARDDADVKLRRARQLFAAQLLPAIDVENAEATLRQADASVKSAQAQVTQSLGSLNQAKVNLAHTIITAPVDGIVIARSVDVGQTVAASMSAPTLFVIAKDLSEMQVNANIDESDIGRIAPGQHVTFRVDAYPNETFGGTVSQVRLQPVVLQNVVSYVTVIDVPNKQLKLKPGMTATVTVEIARADDVLRVPNSALRFRPTPPAGDAGAAAGARPANAAANGNAGANVNASAGAGPAPPAENAGAEGRPRGENRGPRVWVMHEGTLHPVRVETGISDGTTTAIVGGDLSENTQVVTAVATPGATATSSASSPFFPQRPGGNRPGGTNGNRTTQGARR